MLIAAVTSRYPAALEWAGDRMSQAWGAVFRSSQAFEFTETRYYEESMGSGLIKQFWAFESLIDPAKLPACKVTSNQWEQEFARSQAWEVERPVNIDPGYLTEAKLVLATTKDRDHRIYLADGIYAEVTLYFNQGQWKSRPWTYPDYQRSDFQAYFTECRTELRRRYQELKAWEAGHPSTDSP